MPLNDEKLILQIQRGNTEYANELIEKHYPSILRYCTWHCYNTDHAEDLTQETFLRFFEKLSDYRYMGKTKNYLYTIAGNLCRDSYKKIRESLLEEQSLEIQDCLHPPETDELLNRLTIKAALDRLPAELREVIILYYFQELKLTEISSTLQIGLPLVKYRVKQAKTHLERLLREE